MFEFLSIFTIFSLNLFAKLSGILHSDFKKVVTENCVQEQHMLGFFVPWPMASDNTALEL